MNAEKAFAYASEKHAGQTRKGSDKPYVTHPFNVGEIIKENFAYREDLDYLVTCAYLQACLEDTNASYAEIDNFFGTKVALTVLRLTSDSKKIAETGKKEYLAEKLSNMKDDCLLIKLCDRLDNILSANEAGEEFLKNYIYETLYILGAFTEKRTLTDEQTLIKNKILEYIKENKVKRK
jgi:(p)ppGpp synthase/HD superfamily hydrolase